MEKYSNIAAEKLECTPADCYYDDGQDRLIKPTDQDWSDKAYDRFWSQYSEASGCTNTELDGIRDMTDEKGTDHDFR